MTAPSGEQMNQWYYGEHGQQFGPVSDPEMRTMIAAGRISAQTVVWRDGMPAWRPLAEVAELSPGAYVGAMPMMPPVITPSTSLASASLVFGIFGFLLACLWLGYLLGIPAVICGHMALAQIRKDPLRVGGRGMAVAGLVLGYLLSLFMLVVMIGFFVFSYKGSSILR
jgi:hypothetical protein